MEIQELSREIKLQQFYNTQNKYEDLFRVAKKN